MGRLARLRGVWGVALAFVLVYIGVALHLRGGSAPALDAEQLAWRGQLYPVLGVCFGLASLSANRLLGRVGMGEAASRYLSWILAEGVMVLGVVLFISGGPPSAFTGYVIAYVALLLVLFPFGDTKAG